MLLATLLLLALPRQDLAKDLGSTDAGVRLKAIQAIAATGHPQAEKLLLEALEDDDWEIVAIACAELGELRSKKAFDPLVKLALEGPVRGIRRAAAEALLVIDAPAACEKITRKLAGEAAIRALEAVAVLAPAVDGQVKTAPFARQLKEKDSALREAAARTLVAIAGGERAGRLKDLLADEDLAVRAFALEGAAASADPAVAGVLLELLGAAELDDVLERRAQVALREIFLRHGARRPELLAELERAASSAGTKRPRFARLLGILAEERATLRALDPAPALGALDPFVRDADAAVRAAAAAALGRVGGDAALDRALELAAGDADARVRKIALGVAARGRGAQHDATRALLIDRLGKDGDALVREEAAVGLAVKGFADARNALTAALADPEWPVVTCAAVSLGKVGPDPAVKKNGEALIALYQKNAGDWRRRAAAVTGLVHLCAKEGVPTILLALEDVEPLIARTAYEFLASVAHQRLEPKKSVWDAWWLENSRRVQLALPEEALERRKRLGYGRTPQEIYAGLDVLVLQSKGDHIEKVLTALSIEHRLTSQGKIIADGLQPGAVFMANCQGRTSPEEVERLAWFVRAGGSMLGSCWVLGTTIQHIQPGLVRRVSPRDDGPGAALGNVPVYACDPTSPYLEGVFAPDVRPIYHLETSFLIEVLDREQVEVLIDSPQCARLHGGGNLAAWFRVGHGVVLDSANHFDLQGFQTVNDLEKPEPRQVYAVEHLGLSYEALRAGRKERFWGRTETAAVEVKDLSVFRLITNLVRLKRLSQE